MDAFIGEIRPFCLTFAPEGWLACNGSTLVVSQYQALYSIIGNTYGGNQTSFNIPDLRGVIAIGQGQLSNGGVYDFGDKDGVENVTLLQSTVPPHTHVINGAFTTTTPLAAEVSIPANNTYLSNFGSAATSANKIGTAYGHLSGSIPPPLVPSSAIVPLNSQTIGASGGVAPSPGAAPHENRAPFLPIMYCICVVNGEYPVRP